MHWTDAIVPIWLFGGVAAGFATLVISADNDNITMLETTTIATAVVALLPVSLVFATLYGVSVLARLSGRLRHTSKVDKRQKKIERMKELRALDEEYERELDRLIE